MDCTLFGKLLIVFLCVHFGSTCPDQACINTIFQKMLSLNDTNDFCREFFDCVKASCNVTEFPQEFYERLNTILAVNGVHCDFSGQVSSTHRPSFDFSTRMAENSCWGAGECQATFERALDNTTSIEVLCRNLDMLFSCIRNKCGIDKLPYSSLQAFKEKLDFLHTSCDLTKHFDDVSNQSSVTQIITQMRDFVNHVTSTQSTVTQRSTQMTDFVNHVTSTQSTVTQRSTQMTDMLDILKSSATAKTSTTLYAKVQDNTKNNLAGTQSFSFLIFIVGCFVAVLL